MPKLSNPAQRPGGQGMGVILTLPSPTEIGSVSRFVSPETLFQKGREKTLLDRCNYLKQL